MLIDRKAKSYKIVCPNCNKIRFVTYGQNWNIEKGNCSGRCKNCNININTSGLEKGRLWNKGLNVSGMSGHKQSEYQKSVMRKRNLNDNPSKRPEVREKMRLAKIGKPGNTAGKTWKISKEKLKNFGKIKGSDHPNWKGGKTKYYKHSTQTRAYAEWREEVFKQDDYICQICNKKGVYLHPHHIKGWTKYPQLRYEINNGLTLCKSCHIAYHGLHYDDYRAKKNGIRQNV